VDAVCRLAAQRPELAARLELVFAGRRMASQQEHLARLRNLPCRLVMHPYLDHAQALELIRSADGLCLLLSALPGAERVVPAKLFEYMAASRPILAIVPPGECCDLLRDYPAAHRCLPSDTNGIVRALVDELDHHAGGPALRCAVWDGSLYDRRNQAHLLANLLDDLQ
jgi:glycosyltransferase involved in cell wall biosynthesis